MVNLDLGKCPVLCDRVDGVTVLPPLHAALIPITADRPIELIGNSKVQLVGDIVWPTEPC